MADPTDWIKEATRVGVELKESIREAHGLLKDLRDLRRELVVMQTTIVDAVGDRARVAFNEAFSEGMDMYTKGLLKSTDEAFSRVEAMSERALEELTVNVISRMQRLVNSPKRLEL